MQLHWKRKMTADIIPFPSAKDIIKRAEEKPAVSADEILDSYITDYLGMRLESKEAIELKRTLKGLYYDK
jgi:hypothetical protein